MVIKRLEEELEQLRNEHKSRKMEHAQLTEFALTTSKNLTAEINVRIGALGYMNDCFTSKFENVRDEIKLA